VAGSLDVQKAVARGAVWPVALARGLSLKFQRRVPEIPVPGSFPYLLFESPSLSMIVRGHLFRIISVRRRDDKVQSAKSLTSLALPSLTESQGRVVRARERGIGSEG
jgi:hypothetical protein